PRRGYPSPARRERMLYRRRNGNQKPADHREGDYEFGDDAGEVAEDSAPAGPARAYQAFASQKLPGDRAEQRSDQEARERIEETGNRADRGPETSPFRRPKSLRTEISTPEFQGVGQKRQDDQPGDVPPSEALSGQHDLMKDCRRENDNRAGDQRQHRPDQPDGHQHNRNQPPKEFHERFDLAL